MDIEFDVTLSALTGGMGCSYRSWHEAMPDVPVLAIQLDLREARDRADLDAMVDLMEELADLAALRMAVAWQARVS